MTVESATYINTLDDTYPASSDAKSEGDNHIRQLKTVLQATFPNITGAVTPTHTELNYVDGVTSAIQTQLDSKQSQIDAKAPIASPTFTGTVTIPSGASIAGFAPLASPALTGTPTAPTTATADSSTKLATTALVDAKVSAAVFVTTLPNQSGNGGKFVTTDGTTASWGFTGIENVSTAGALTGNAWNFQANESYTLPDLTANDKVTLVCSGEGYSVPTSIATSDGWSLATGFSGSTVSMATPNSTATPHGTWGSKVLTPPLLATISADGAPTILGSVSLSATLMVVLYKTSGIWAVAINPATDTVGDPVNLGGYNAGIGAWIFADSATSFVVGYNGSSTTSYIQAGSVSGTTITAGTRVQIGSNIKFICAPVQLAAGLYIWAGSESGGKIQAASVSGTVVTMGTAVTSGAVSNNVGYIQVLRSSATEALVVVLATGGGTSTTRSTSAVIASVSGTVITLGTPSAGGNICANSGLNLLHSYVDGSTYLCVAKDGTTATTGNWYGITVSGTTATLGALNAQVNNLPALRYGVDTYINQPGQDNYAYDSTTLLCGHLSAGPFAVTISGTTLTFGATLALGAVTTFVSDVDTGANCYALYSGGYSKISVSAGTITQVTAYVSTVPTYVFSDSFSTRLAIYDSVAYAWNVPTSAALSSTRTLSISGNDIKLTGPIT